MRRRDEIPLNPDIQTALDQTLIEGLPRGLKDAIDAALAMGGSKAEILRRVHVQTGGPTAPRGGLTYLAVEAYLEDKP